MDQPAKFTIQEHAPRYTSDDSFNFRRKGQHTLADDMIHQGHVIHLGWMDRLRALFGRAVHLNVVTPVRVVIHEDGGIPEVSVGTAVSSAFAERFFRPRLGRLTTNEKV